MSDDGITVEEAVAKILKFDYVIGDIGLFETLAAFESSATNEYNEEIEGGLVTNTGLLQQQICKVRCEQAEFLSELLNDAYCSILLEIVSAEGEERRFSLESVDYWASYYFGIEILPSSAKRTNNEKDKPVYICFALLFDLFAEKEGYVTAKNHIKISPAANALSRFASNDLIGQSESTIRDIYRLSAGVKGGGKACPPAQPETMKKRKVTLAILAQVIIASKKSGIENKSDLAKYIENKSEATGYLTGAMVEQYFEEGCEAQKNY